MGTEAKEMCTFCSLPTELQRDLKEVTSALRLRALPTFCLAYPIKL